MSRKSKTKRSRRWMLGVGLAATAGGGVFAATWFNIFADVSADGALSVRTANALATKGEIYLIDIRRPDEWRRTGVGRPAIPIDMRRKDFETTLQALIDKEGVKPVALICARGVRSNRLNARLMAAGFTNLIDVPEGMLGSGAGPGWLARTLPLRPPTSAELNGQVLAGI